MTAGEAQLVLLLPLTLLVIVVILLVAVWAGMAISKRLDKTDYSQPVPFESSEESE